MARNKLYNEEEVLEKAMNLFWKNGYETTSMQMLEKEMGINKFSIYSSFGSKNSLLIESIKCYRAKLTKILIKLQKSNNGILGIKQYFYDFLEFSKENDITKGCLISNTANELNGIMNEELENIISKFLIDIQETFKKSLLKSYTYSDTELKAKIDYLMVAMFGLSHASKAFTEEQLNNYIENIFN